MKKEIEEMKITVLNCFRDENGCKNCKYFNGIYCTSYALGVAEALYNAGYRKAEEARKEIVEEICADIAELESERVLAWEYGAGWIDCKSAIKKYFRTKYGVEVEE